MTRDMRKHDFCICEGKSVDRSSAALVSLHRKYNPSILKPKFQVPSHFLLLYSPVCVGTLQGFLRRGSYVLSAVIMTDVIIE